MYGNDRSKPMQINPRTRNALHHFNLRNIMKQNIQSIEDFEDFNGLTRYGFVSQRYAFSNRFTQRDQVEETLLDRTLFYLTGSGAGILQFCANRLILVRS